MCKTCNFVLGVLLSLSQYAYAGGREDFNDCRTASGDFCERAGSCAIQGSAWYQYAKVAKSGKFDTQGWPGLCDMVHVSLVQGDCSPFGGQENVTAYLSDVSYADIPSVSGSLACAGAVETNIEICNDGIDNDLDGKTDCSDKRDCRKDSFCR